MRRRFWIDSWRRWAEEFFLYKRPHHRRIADLLDRLDGELLATNCCYFGGGTAITLRYGEFRESVDVDFLV